MTGTHRITHISFPNMEETEYHDITSGIAEGSLLLDEILLTDGLNFGEANANRFEVQLYNISDVSGQKIVVWQTETDTTTPEIPIFVGYVDSCKQNHSGYYRQIVAYDIMYKTSTQDVTQWWSDFWYSNSEGATIKDMRDALIEEVGIDTVILPQKGYLNDSVVVNKLKDESSLTFGTVLKMICELQATIPTIDRSGNLDFIVLSNSSIDESSNVNKGDSIFEEFNILPINVVWIYDANHNVIGYGGPGASNPYKIQGNLLVRGIQNIDSVATSIYNAIKNITYTPGSMKYIVSDLDLKLGAFVKYGSHYTYIFENVLSGPILIEQESRSGGSQYIQENTNLNSSISTLNERISTSQIQYRKFSNAEAVTIDDSEEKLICSERFVADKGTVVEFILNAVIDVETLIENDTYHDAVGTFTFEVNGVIVQGWNPIETWADGTHYIHLYHLMEISSRDPQQIQVYLSMSGGSAELGIGDVRAYLSGQGLATASSQPIEQNLLTREQQNLDNWNSANVFNSSVLNSYQNNENFVTVYNDFVPGSHTGPDGNNYEYLYHINWVASSSVTMDYYIWSHGKLAGWTGGWSTMGYVVCYNPTYQNYLETLRTNDSNSIWICQLYRNGQLDTLGHGSVPAIGVTSSDVTFYSPNAEECVNYLLTTEHHYPRKYLAFSTEIGKTYTFRAKMCTPSGFSCSEEWGGYDQEWVAVTNDVPTNDSTLKEYTGSFVDIDQAASTVRYQYAAIFTATATTHYLVLDFGQINEETTATFAIKVGVYEV